MLRRILYIIMIFMFLSSVRGQELSFKTEEHKLPFGLVEKQPDYIPSIGIALSGGGSRGFAHIGFLEAIEKANIPVENIVGTSIGSIIGGLYSAGYSLKTLREILLNTDWERFTSSRELKRNELFIDQKLTEDRAILTFRLDGLKPIIPTSISSGQSMSSFLNSLTLNAPLHIYNSFDELLYHFRAVATNLEKGDEVIIGRGSLTRAMRASSSVSFFLPPVKYDSLMLVDGGLVANVPAKITRKLGSDVVIASNTTSSLKDLENLKYPWEVADQLVSIPMQHLTMQNLRVIDLLVEPDLKGIANNDFSKVKYVYKQGLKAAESKIEKMRKLYKNIFIHNFKRDTTIDRLLLPDNPNEVEAKLSRYLNTKSKVKLSEIYFALSEIFREGIYNELKPSLIENPNGTLLKVNYNFNSPVNQVRLNGFSKRDSSGLIEKYFSGLIDKPFSARSTLNSVLNLLRDFRKQGLFLFEIDSIAFNNNILDVYSTPNSSLNIKVEGNIKTNKHVILREFAKSNGIYFSIEDIKRGLINLQATNLFADVEADLIKQNKSVQFIIKVIEKSTNLLRLGLRVDNENFTQVYLDLREENLFGTGTELGLIFQSGTRKRSLIIEQKSNRIFNTYLTYKIRMYSRFEDVNVYKDDPQEKPNAFSRSKVAEYRQIFSGVSLGIGTQAKKFGNLIVEGRYERNELKNKTNYLGDTYISVLSALKFSLNIDSQNKFPYPTNGYLVSSYYETAQTSLGSDLGYSKFYFDYKSYYSFGSTSTLIPRFVLGFADETLPLVYQFSLGGQYSFFGYRDFEYRGRQVFVTSLAYRYKLPVKIFFDTYVKFRYDLGSIWKEESAIKFKDLKHGIGATISFDTPLGRADFSVGRSFYFVNEFSKNAIKRGPVFFYFTIGY